MIIKSLKHLQAVLHYELTEIEEILANKEKHHYHFQRSKGVVKGIEEFRHFNPSKKNLRDIQNRIHSRIFSDLELPWHIQGCVKGRGNVTNSKMHKGKLYKFHTDLKSYFNFVSNEKVYNGLVDMGFSQKVAHYLTQLCTFEGHLAQGPPTSPFLANIAGLVMDRDILQLCGQHGITYTRFVDDLGFSSSEDFKELTLTIKAIINKHKFLIGYGKTKYKIGRLELTGVDIGQNVLRPTKKQLAKYVDPLTQDHTRKGLEIYFAGLKKK